MGEYEKNRLDIYDVLRQYLHNAIKHAKDLIKLHDNDAPSRNAPGRAVFEIFDFLKAYL
jgi:hypothetical protein